MTHLRAISFVNVDSVDSAGDLNLNALAVDDFKGGDETVEDNRQLLTPVNRNTVELSFHLNRHVLAPESESSVSNSQGPFVKMSQPLKSSRGAVRGHPPSSRPLFFGRSRQEGKIQSLTCKRRRIDEH